MFENICFHYKGFAICDLHQNKCLAICITNQPLCLECSFKWKLVETDWFQKFRRKSNLVLSSCLGEKSKYLRFVCFEVYIFWGLYVFRFVDFEVYMGTSLNRFSGYQSGLARHGFDKKLPTFLDVSVKLFTILIPEMPLNFFFLTIFPEPTFWEGIIAIFSRWPCYVFCICLSTDKYEKYKSVELGDQLHHIAI